MSELLKFTEYIKNNTVLEAAQIQKEAIKNFSGQIIGYIYLNPNGDQELKNYSGKILGRYVKGRNVTQNYSGTILSYGNTLAMLLK